MAMIASLLLVSGCSTLPSDSKSATWVTTDVDVKLATAVDKGDKPAIAELTAKGADPDAVGVEGLSGGASFQDYYFNFPPKNALNEESLAQRAAIMQ